MLLISYYGDEIKNLFDGENYPGNPLKIYTYPAPVLKIVASEVVDFNQGLKDFVIDMIHTMYMAPGIGLAAPQVGKSIRLFVSDIDFEREEIETEDGEVITDNNLSPKVYINPKITKTEGEILYEERVALAFLVSMRKLKDLKKSLLNIKTLKEYLTP